MVLCPPCIKLLLILASAVLLIYLALKQAEHRRAMRPQRPPCLCEASLGAVPHRPRSAGHRSGFAGSASVRRRAFGFFWLLKRNSGTQRTKRLLRHAVRIRDLLKFHDPGRASLTRATKAVTATTPCPNVRARRTPHRQTTVNGPGNARPLRSPVKTSRPGLPRHR